ncbi:hypothetical protein D2M30_1575 [Bacillus amyloliquefaciens]|nr:hypothetical protein D2M30_1575 [Bacillus amyloliquefaciens]
MFKVIHFILEELITAYIPVYCYIVISVTNENKKTFMPDKGLKAKR